jgi:hypothetical protein
MTSLVLILFSAELVAEELKFTNGIHSYKADSFFVAMLVVFNSIQTSFAPDW